MTTIYKTLDITIDDKVLNIMRFTRISVATILCLIQIVVGIVVKYNFFDFSIFYIFAGLPLLLLYVLYVFFITKLERDSYSYSLTDTTLIIQEGVFFKSRTIIPYNIIQNIDIERGPIMRKYNFSNIKVSSIATTEVIKFIKDDIAEEIKKQLVDNKNRYKIKF